LFKVVEEASIRHEKFDTYLAINQLQAERICCTVSAYMLYNKCAHVEMFKNIGTHIVGKLL